MNQVNALFDQVVGQSSGTGARQQPDQGGGLNLQSLINGPGGLATGALAGGLTGLLIGGKKPRKLANSALKVGGVALVGGLAYKAWRDWQANKAPQSTQMNARTDDAPIAAEALGTPFMPTSVDEERHISRALMRAMIAAAKADGEITEGERLAISERLAALNLDAADKVFIDEELAAPLDIAAVARGAACPEQAAEIYAASLLVIDPQGAAERGYLAMLAARLNLEPGLVDHLHAGADLAFEQEAA